MTPGCCQAWLNNLIIVKLGRCFLIFDIRWYFFSRVKKNPTRIVLLGHDGIFFIFWGDALISFLRKCPISGADCNCGTLVSSCSNHFYKMRPTFFICHFMSHISSSFSFCCLSVYNCIVQSLSVTTSSIFYLFCCTLQPAGFVFSVQIWEWHWCSHLTRKSRNPILFILTEFSNLLVLFLSSHCLFKSSLYWSLLTLRNLCLPNAFWYL